MNIHKTIATAAAVALLTAGLSSCGKPEAPTCELTHPITAAAYAKGVEFYETTDKLTLDDLASMCRDLKESDKGLEAFGDYMGDGVPLPDTTEEDPTDDPTKTSAEVQAENMEEWETETQ